jgi:hypothetical protein
MCCQMSDKAVADSPAVHHGRSARTLKMNFMKPDTFGFSGFQQADGLHLVSDSTLHSFRQSAVEVM